MECGDVVCIRSVCDVARSCKGGEVVQIDWHSVSHDGVGCWLLVDGNEGYEDIQDGRRGGRQELVGLQGCLLLLVSFYFLLKGYPLIHIPTPTLLRPPGLARSPPNSTPGSPGSPAPSRAVRLSLLPAVV